MYIQLDWKLPSALQKTGADANRFEVQGLLFPVWEVGSVLGASLSSHRVVPEVQAERCSDGDFCPANMHNPMRTCHRSTVIEQLRDFQFAPYQPGHRKYSHTVFNWSLFIYGNPP